MQYFVSFSSLIRVAFELEKKLSTLCLLIQPNAPFYEQLWRPALHIFLSEMPLHNFTHGNDTALGLKSAICTVFSMFNIVLAHANYF